MPRPRGHRCTPTSIIARRAGGRGSGLGRDAAARRLGVAAAAGQEVVALGAPLGLSQNTVTRGIVSGVRQARPATLVQTDAAINPGQQRRPAARARTGEVIGITTMGVTSAQGLSFAVAIDHATAARSSRPDQRRGDGTPLSGLNAALQSAARRQSDARPAAAGRRSRATSRRCRPGRATGRRARRALAAVPCACVLSRAVPPGAYDREWFALWDPRARCTGAVAPACGRCSPTSQTPAEAIRDAVMRRPRSRPARRRLPRHPPRHRAGVTGWTTRAGTARRPAMIVSRADRHRRAEAARLRHRHLHPQPAAAARAPRSRRPSSSCSCRPEDCAALGGARRELPRRRRDGAATTRSPSSSRFRCALRREGVTLFHAPHYVLPPLVRCRVGRDDPRLHPPDVSAVPAEPARPRLRADVDRAGRAARRRGC